MKRDLDLLRNILIEIEKKTPSDHYLSSDDIEIQDHSHNEIAYHIALLSDAQYIIASAISADDQTTWLISRLTFSGCDYLDTIRSNKVWNTLKEKLAETVQTASLEVIKLAAIEISRQILMGTLHP
jgi:hypothetical protein